MEFFEWYLKALKNYKDFSGRARRKEYWMFALCNVIVSIVLSIIDSILGSPILSSIYSLVVLVPGIAVSVRRLHDIGKSGWSLLIGLIPLVGLIVIWWLIQDGESGTNKWGANPKGV